MITTTVLIAVQFKYVKGLSPWFGLLFFLAFGFVDGTIILCTVDLIHRANDNLQDYSGEQR